MQIAQNHKTGDCYLQIKIWFFSGQKLSIAIVWLGLSTVDQKFAEWKNPNAIPAVWLMTLFGTHDFKNLEEWKSINNQQYSAYKRYGFDMAQPGQGCLFLPGSTQNSRSNRLSPTYLPIFCKFAHIRTNTHWRISGISSKQVRVNSQSLKLHQSDCWTTGGFRSLDKLWKWGNAMQYRPTWYIALVTGWHPPPTQWC